jgi:hypothetical protein
MSLYEREIYKIDEELRNFEESNPDIELTPEIVKSILDGISIDFNTKVINICKYIKTLEGNIMSYKTELTRIRSNKEKDEVKIKNLKQYVVPYIEQKGKSQYGTFKVGLRKSESVFIEDIKSIDDAYKHYEQIISINKMKVKEAIKAGEEVQGASLISNNNLQIK